MGKFALPKLPKFKMWQIIIAVVVVIFFAFLDGRMELSQEKTVIHPGGAVNVYR